MGGIWRSICLPRCAGDHHACSVLGQAGSAGHHDQPQRGAGGPEGELIAMEAKQKGSRVPPPGTPVPLPPGQCSDSRGGLRRLNSPPRAGLQVHGSGPPLTLSPSPGYSLPGTRGGAELPGAVLRNLENIKTDLQKTIKSLTCKSKYRLNTSHICL